MGMLAWVLPDEAAVLVIVGIGFALIVGLRRVARGLLGLLAIMILTPFLLPFIDVVIGAMPLWLLFVVGGTLCLALFRGALGVLVGRDAARHAVGHIVAEVILGIVRLLFLPLRLIVGRRS